jgi:hydroxypyruvate reductase
MMIAAEQFSTYSLRNHPHGAGIQRILAAAVQAVEPGAAVRKFVQRSGEKLRIGNRDYDLEKFNRILLIGIGKAAPAMTDALHDVLGERISAGLIVTKYRPVDHSGSLPIFEAGHPIPDERSLFAGEQILSLLEGVEASDLVICLISGGGSALVTCPYPGITLAELQALTAQLLACGARIDEINTLRRQLDRLKGGGLAQAAAPAQLVSLILSDVVGNPLEAIASGPTVADPTTRKDALNILDRYQLRDKVPESILNILAGSPDKLLPEKAGLKNVHNLIVGSNLLAAQAALAQARREGFNTYLMRTDLQGEAREVAHELCNHLRWAWQRADPVPRPACILAGGETTVSLRGDGRGGRNLELALSAVTDLADFPDVMLVTLATDGEDGVTDAAGAVVTGDSFDRAAELGLQPEAYLARNDSYPFFSALEDLLKPGPTGTNVNDLTFLFTF